MSDGSCACCTFLGSAMHGFCSPCSSAPRDGKCQSCIVLLKSALFSGNIASRPPHALARNWLQILNGQVANACVGCLQYTHRMNVLAGVVGGRFGCD